jgi:hypothetical protein
MVVLALALARQVAGLDKPIGIAEYAVPAPLVCRDLAKLAGVPMACDSFLTNDLVVLVVKHRPAKEIMAKVASTFGWRWVPDRGGYRLTPSDEFRHKAATGRYAILAEEGGARQQAAREVLERARALGPHGLRAQLVEAARKVGNGGAPSSPSTDREKEFLDKFGQCENPAALVGLAVFAELSPEELVHLYDDRLVAGSNPGPLEIRLGPDADAELAHCAERLQNPDPELPPAAFDGLGGAWKYGEIVGADIELDSWDRATVALRIRTGTELNWAAVNFPAAPAASHTAFSAVVQGAIRKAPQLDASAPPATSTDAPRSWLEGYAGWLESAARILDADVISDAYDPYPQDEEKPLARAEVLCELGAKPILADGWLVIRDENWPRHREEQLPREIIRNFQGPAEQISLDKRAAGLGHMTLAQLRSPFISIDRTDYWVYHLWNEIPDQMRDALRAGKVFHLNELPACFIEYLYEMGERPKHTEGIDYPALWHLEQPFVEPEFLNLEPLLKNVVSDADDAPNAKESDAELPRNMDFARLYPAEADIAAPVSLQVVDVPGIQNAESGVRYTPLFLSDILKDDPNMRTALVGAKHLRLQTARGYRLHIRIRPSYEVQGLAVELSVGAPLSADRATWPKELLDRVRRWDSISDRIRAVITMPGQPPPG